MNNAQRYLPVIEACNACVVACEACAAACADAGMSAEHNQQLDVSITLNRDCADICRLAARLMERESALVDEICRLCAITCQGCAQECAKHAMDECQQCAQVCQRCVEQCEEITAGA